MDSILDIAVYIIEANIAYLIFSLIRQGFKHYSSYIAELIFLLILTIYLTLKGVAIGWVFAIALIGIALTVIIPFWLQGQIDRLMEDNCYNEIAPLAKLKASLAWSSPNSHLQEMAEIADEFYERPELMLVKLRELLGQGEPYDGMTRMFLGMIHFNKRDFNELVTDLKIPNEDFSKQSFEELLYLVRGYLETTRYDEAVAAQFALESKVYDDEFNDKKLANAIVNRFVFYAFMGWIDEYKALMDDDSANLNEGLPEELKSFWRGVCTFNSGDYIIGVKQMENVIERLSDDKDIWRDFMLKRLHGMLENKDFFDKHVLPKLKELHEKHSNQLLDLVAAQKKENAEITPVSKATNTLAFVILVLSVIWLYVCSVDDNIEVIKMGANGAYFIANGEYYRLFSYMFIHSGLTHLIMNLIALRYFGVVVETVVGWQVFLAIFFVSGIVGGLVSSLHGCPLSIGASGGVMGLLGAALAFCMVKSRINTGISKQISFSTLFFIFIINIAFGLIENGKIDNFAHLGGTLAGFVCALVYLPAIKCLKLKSIYNFIAIVFCVLAMSGALITHSIDLYNNNFYPKSLKEFQSYTSKNKIFCVNIPKPWVGTNQENEAGETFIAIGSANEHLTCSAGLYKGEPESFLKTVIEEKVNSFENVKGLELVSVHSPLLSPFKPSTYSVKWVLNNDGHRLGIEEFYIFCDDVLGYIKFQAYTDHMNEYTPVLEKIVNSFEFKTQTKLDDKEN